MYTNNCIFAGLVMAMAVNISLFNTDIAHTFHCIAHSDTHIHFYAQNAYNTRTVCLLHTFSSLDDSCDFFLITTF